MNRSTMNVETPKGPCPTEVLTPEGSGPWPAVILCFDAGGPRPALSEIGARVAKMGCLVAIPDFYHRVGRLSDLLPSGGSFFDLFKNPELRKQWMTTFYATALDYDVLREDVGALLAALRARPDFRGGIGTTGYCMGGNLSLRIATVFGDAIAATASFHGGGLVTAAPDSPHLRVGGIKSRVYVAGAIEDPLFSDAAKQTLAQALDAAHVVNIVETYPAKHGFVVSDNGSYDAAAAARHDVALEALFGATLHRAS